ncbi:alpha-E domain-containing protein [Paenibacillus sp. GCM10023250]|uniref:alpha-E domain-containing protein n=1 Tax=Paenibacillus sp. GCM10023250 TaxID=3252648 RepID=UPI0036230384
MLNRNAEALFWIGRYMERAENHARLIDVHYHLQDEDAPPIPRDGADGRSPALCKWGRIVDALGSRAAYEQQYGSAYNEQDVVHYVTLDRDHANSLVTCVNHARDNVRTLREKLPSELWDVANGFYLWLREKQAGDPARESPHQFFGRIKEWTALFCGVTQSVMPRENEWHFIECGRYLERTENTLRIIQSAIAASASAAEAGDDSELYPYLQAVLRSVSGYQPFRRHYADGVSADAIIEFLVLNEAFPRSVQFSLDALDRNLRGIELQEKQLRAAHDRIIRQVVKLKAELACLEREDLGLDREGAVTGRLLLAAGQLGNAFAQTFFRIGEATA